MFGDFFLSFSLFFWFYQIFSFLLRHSIIRSPPTFFLLFFFILFSFLTFISFSFIIIIITFLRIASTTTVTFAITITIRRTIAITTWGRITIRRVTIWIIIIIVFWGRFSLLLFLFFDGNLFFSLGSCFYVS